MPWAQLDDELITDLKTRTLSHTAFRVWVLGLVYCQRELTDGFIPSAALGLFGLRDKELRNAVTELTSTALPGKCPLWNATADATGYTIHDYLDWNASRTSVIQRRERDGKRLKKWRAGRVRNGVSSTVSDGVTPDSETHGVAGSPSPSPKNPPTPLRAVARSDDDPQGQTAVARYCELLVEHHQCKPVLDGKDTRALKGHVQASGLSRVLAGLDAYFANGEEFYKGHPLSLFVRRASRFMPDEPKAAPPPVKYFDADEHRAKLRAQGLIE